MISSKAVLAESESPLWDKTLAFKIGHSFSSGSRSISLLIRSIASRSLRDLILTSISERRAETSSGWEDRCVSREASSSSSETVAFWWFRDSTEGVRGDAIAGGGLRWRFAKRRAEAAVKVTHVDLRIREGSDGFDEEEALMEARLKESDEGFWGDDEGD